MGFTFRFSVQNFMVVQTKYSGVELCHIAMGFENCRVGWLRRGSRERVR